MKDELFFYQNILHDYNNFENDIDILIKIEYIEGLSLYYLYINIPKQ